MTEWLETDGLGGYAMGTADLIRTRRYHALLLAATRPPEGRMVLVADLEVFVETATGRYALTSHRYRNGVVHPDGATRITKFEHAPWPQWEWTLPDGTVIGMELAVAHGAPRVAVRWRRIAGAAVALHVQPLLAGRDYHATHHENGVFRFEPDIDRASRDERVTWRPYPGVPAVCAVANAIYQHAPDWYRAFDLADEAERGLDHLEDLASPGTFTFDLASGSAAMLLAADTPPAGGATELVDAMFANERRRRAAFEGELARAADAYLARRDGGKTVLAGYPWFSDWGRDTFISLRGLTLARASDRRSEARAILLQWAGAISDGMLPNRYDEGATTPEYNSVDAALWFVIAADAYLTSAPASPDDRRRLTEAIAAIVDGYAAGTRHGIRRDADGLVACGVPGLQLTWMDAKIGGDVITPRIGKPVEIQALWINALAIAGRTAEAERARAAFAERFWDPGRGYLYDVVDCDHVAGTADPSCRPNQLFAIGGLPHQVIDGERARAVVDTVERVLWTPAGPRTLAPADPRYCPRFTGGPETRDRAYHQGTVWPWLAGAFVEAWVRVRGGTAEARREARTRFWEPLAARRDLAGLGHVAEICEPEPPYRPVGCPFQAWSLAELIRLDTVLTG